MSAVYLLTLNKHEANFDVVLYRLSLNLNFIFWVPLPQQMAEWALGPQTVQAADVKVTVCLL